jgi:hypothetical protein
MTNQATPTWTCPVCDSPAPFDTLNLDGYFVKVLSSPLLSEDVKEVRLQADGTCVLLEKVSTTIKVEDVDENLEEKPVGTTIKVENAAEQKTAKIKVEVDDASQPSASYGSLEQQEQHMAMIKEEKVSGKTKRGRTVDAVLHAAKRMKIE